MPARSFADAAANVPFRTSNGAAGAGRSLSRRYVEVRAFTEHLCEPLEIEDYVVQSMPDASPVKWHLAHTSWFWDTFLLTPQGGPVADERSAFVYLFNSYYNSVGPQFHRPSRGLLTRPTVSEVYRYRHQVDERMEALLERADHQWLGRWGWLVELGLHHEQQHQELILTDVKHALCLNLPLPIYRPLVLREHGAAAGSTWIAIEGGIRKIGHEGGGFAFDNECPRHETLVPPFRLARRPITCGEFRAFMEDDGYSRPELWLSAGWSTAREQGWTAPLYWQQEDGAWMQFTLGGLREVAAAEPVCHVSFYEADAYARWAGARLPTEEEWEAAAETVPVSGGFVEEGRYHPAGSDSEGSGSEAGPVQMFGEVWQWTGSQYRPYPGFRPAEGAVGEYNGKFMCNQFVLRGGSCATSRTHIRRTYRNFFPPEARWQFTGIRLAADA